MVDHCASEEGVRVHTHGRLRCSGSVEVKGDVFSFKVGPTGCVLLMEPLSPMLNYYECEIIGQGANAAIGIGIGEQTYPLNRMPGWNQRSIGYHGDDGKLYHENGSGRGFGPMCAKGDRMGCGVDFDHDVGYGYCEVFFTKNGEQVGDPVRMERPVFGLYPIIGLHNRGQKVRYLGHWCRQRQGLLEPMTLDHSPSNIWLRSNGIQFVDDGMTLKYWGQGGNAQDPSLAQAKFPLNESNHYFEVLILSAGSLGAIAIGLGELCYPLHTHPGWSSGAVGYHADDGKLFVECGQGRVFGPSCCEGDRMGCGVLFHSLYEDRDDEAANEEGQRTEGERRQEEYEEDSDDLADMLFESDGSMDSDEDLDVPEPNMMGLGLAPPWLRPPLQGRRNVFNRMVYQRGIGQRRHVVDRQAPRRQVAVARPSLTIGNADTDKCEVYFTKNGQQVGKIEVSIPKGGLYPLVGMLSKGEVVQVDLQPLTG